MKKQIVFQAIMNSLSQYIGILKAASSKPNTRRPLTEYFIGQQTLTTIVEKLYTQYKNKVKHWD